MFSVLMRIKFDAVFQVPWIDIRDGWIRGVFLPGAVDL
jgi:hypothetical protein